MIKKPWYVLALDRIEQNAHELTMQVLVIWCEFLKGAEIPEEERALIIIEFDRIIGELVRPEEEIVKDYLGRIRGDLSCI